jgi:hypothetical protein
MHRLAAAAVCVISLATAATAVGAQGQVSTLSFDFARGNATWKGRVSSPVHACEGHRRVAVMKLQPGPDALVARVRADARGRYWAHGNVEYETYYAQVRREKRGAKGAWCRGDRSPTITIAPVDPA